MTSAILPVLGLAALAAAAAARSSAGTTTTTTRSRGRADARACRYTASTIPLDRDPLVLRWARCAGRTAGEVETLYVRGMSAGKPPAWGAALRRAFQQAQALASRPPDGVSPAARREVDRVLARTDEQARSAPLPEEPETLEQKIAAEQAQAQQATARAREVARAGVEQAQVAGLEEGPPPTIEIESPASGFDPQLARRLASQTARAVRDRLPGAELNVRHFQQAAGLPPGPYDPRTAAALRYFGIRNAPPASGAPASYNPPHRETP